MSFQEALAPDRALSSAMSSSQTGTMSSRERQKLWSRRASNSSMEVPLLLDPGVIAEIEDAVAVGVGALEDVVLARRRAGIRHRPGRRRPR